MKKVVKYLCSIILLSVVLCSFWGLGNSTISYGTDKNLYEQISCVSQGTNVDEIIRSEEISVSTSQAAIVRQLSTRKSSVSLMVLYILLNAILATLLFFSFSFSFSGLYYCASSSSHRFIITYIHNKDGQKA